MGTRARETLAISALLATPSLRASLDWLNFFLADVKGGLGPYVGVFLLTEQHWDEAEIGLVVTVASVLGLAFQTPIGAAIDSISWKRGIIVAGVVALNASAMAIAFAPIFAEPRWAFSSGMMQTIVLMKLWL